jgi:D-3-phosphoglycerate dehydrogenase
LFLIFLLFRAPSADSLTIRILNVHQNVPGVLRQITRILSDYNIEKQICDSKASIGYFMADVTIEKEQDMITIRDALANVSESILNRLLF